MTFDDEIKALQDKILELQKAKEADEKKKALEKLITVKIHTYDDYNEVVFVNASEYRHDFVELCQSIHGRKWNSIYKRNEIPLSQFAPFIIAVSVLPNVELEYLPSVRKAIEADLNAPYLYIERHDESRITLKFKDKFSYQSFAWLEVRSLLVQKKHKQFTLPINEAYRLYKAIESLRLDKNIDWEKAIIWEAGLKEDVDALVNKRLQLDIISTAEDAPEYAIQLNNGIIPRPYQRVGVKFCKYTDGNALIGDEPGLGKSLQAILYAMTENLRVLFIVPAPTKENWNRYIKAYTGEEPKFFWKSEPDKIDIENLLLPNKKKQYNLMHYDMLSRAVTAKDSEGNETDHYMWSKFINASKFDLIVLDECHKIKNMSAARTKAVLQLKAPKVIGLSGTPILNRPGEFFPFLHLIKPNEFKIHEDFIRRYTDGKNGVRNEKELRELLRPIMIRRKNADVNKDLPPIIRINEYIEMTNTENVEYQRILQGVYTNLYGKEVSVITILAELTRLKQYTARVKAPHVAEFAQQCYQDAVDAEDEHKKVLIGTQWIETAIQIKKILGDECLLITGESGDPKYRLSIVDKFQEKNDTYKYLVCTYGAAGEGLNITAAGTVINNDLGWNPALHQQFEGRAYGRANDLHGCKSYYFMCPKTVEDWIWELLQEKLQTIELTVDGVQSDRKDESSIVMAIFNRLKNERKVA